MNNLQEEMETLYNHFGLCPDYKIVFTENYWVEYYEPPVNIYKQTPTYDYHKPEFESTLDVTFIPKSKRAHLNKHTVLTEDGFSISANFTVSHSTKTIFLKVSHMGEYGEIKQYDEENNE
jgi:hypothetical protein